MSTVHSASVRLCCENSSPRSNRRQLVHLTRKSGSLRSHVALAGRSVGTRYAASRINRSHHRHRRLRCRHSRRPPTPRLRNEIRDQFQRSFPVDIPLSVIGASPLGHTASETPLIVAFSRPTRRQPPGHCT